MRPVLRSAGQRSRPTSFHGARRRRPRRSARPVRAGRLALFLVALYVFVLAIQLMKAGALPLSATISRGFFPFDNLVSTLGLGMVLAYLTLSGKPPAALALAFFAGGGITRLETYTMISGGRLGAAFVVLLVGFLYAARGRDRREAVGMGVLSLALTAIVYLPAIAIGYGILKLRLLAGVDLTSLRLSSVIDLAWGPLVSPVSGALPAGALVAVGVVLIVAAIKLLDAVLPEVDAERQAWAHRAVLSRPWAMFLIGSVVTLVTLSVSVALTVLVPLAARGYIRRREAVPYIMGANVTTLADTLLIAVVAGNPVGVQIVLAEFLAVLAVTVVCLVFAYRRVQERVIALDEWVMASGRRLALFVAGLFVLPGLLMLSGLLVGHPLGR